MCYIYKSIICYIGERVEILVNIGQFFYNEYNLIYIKNIEIF